MKVALVTAATPTPALAGYVRGLTSHLEARVELSRFDESNAARVNPETFDHILYLLENDEGCGFMAEMIRSLGGLVVLQEWNLGRMAYGARRALGEGGLAGRLAALREGGFAGLRAFDGGAAPSDQTLNRSVIRFADGFFVHEADLGHRIIDDRNAATPVGLFEHTREDLDRDPELYGELSAKCVEFLERAPAPRAKKRGSLIERVRRELAARRAAESPA